MKKIILLLILTVFFTPFISGCEIENKNVPTQEKNIPQNLSISSELKTQVMEQQKKERESSAYFEMVEIKSPKEKIRQIDLILHNPQRKEISSFQSWLTYPNKDIEIREIKNHDLSSFNFFAPGEKDNDPKLGILKIGASTTGENTASEQMLPVASIIFEKKSAGPAQIEYFYPEEKVKIITIEEDETVNILRKEKLIPIIISK